jgi:hypothetical protein
MTDCRICRETPGSHSFVKLSESDGVSYYYTCPAKASRYDDLEGIEEHYRLELSKLNGSSFVWIFDGDGFDMRHVMEIRVGICISKILEEYSVKRIYVINPSIYVRIIRSMLWGMLSENLRSKIEFE